MRVPLSEHTEARLRRLFEADEIEEARRLLVADCAENVPGWELAGLDRLRAAVLKLSGGSISKLVDAIALAQTDVRDALVCAGFGNDVRAHESWWPE